VEEEKKLKKKEAENYEEELIERARTPPAVPQKIQANPTLVNVARDGEPLTTS
jgi:hypothetical protein